MAGPSFVGLLKSVAREAARQQRLAEAEHRRNLRDQVQAQRAAERARALAAKEARERHLQEQIARAEDLTVEANDRISQLRRVLTDTPSIDDTISFDSLRINEPFPPLSPDPQLTKADQPPTEDTFLADIQPPSFLAKLVPGAEARYQEAMDRARAKYQEALDAQRRQEASRGSKLAAEQQKYDDAKAAHDLKVAQRNAEVDEFAAGYARGDPKAIVGYCTMVLERSDYPEGFPQEFRVAYVPESKELVIEYELPGADVIPRTAEFRYVKSKDSIEEKPRKEVEIKELYQDIVAAVALRTCHEEFEADQANRISVVAFNGFVQTIDPSTGQDIRPCLISLRVTKERFLQIDLARVDKKVCLRNLGAQVSPRPYEVQSVKPIVEFDMVDKRFVEESDILADLESRPNLMDLNPFEFENLVCNLFKQLGLETKLTRSSRDGGVDVVAYDLRPVIGGKVVIQAKRYSNTVGVAAVRDLFGTMMNEGANKGILVTTSGYGPDAFEFAKDKPIELLDGGRLLYLLGQVGIHARIVFPAEGAQEGT